MSNWYIVSHFGSENWWHPVYVGIQKWAITCTKWSYEKWQRVYIDVNTVNIMVPGRSFILVHRQKPSKITFVYGSVIFHADWISHSCCLRPYCSCSVIWKLFYQNNNLYYTPTPKTIIAQCLRNSINIYILKYVFLLIYRFCRKVVIYLCLLLLWNTVPYIDKNA